MSKKRDGDVEVTESASIPCAIPRQKNKAKRDVFRIKGGNIELVGKTVKYLDEDMKLIREENVDSCVENNIRENYPDFEAFKTAWNMAYDKPAFAMDLLLHQRFVDEFRAELGYNVDYYDMIAFVGYGISIPTKQVRIDRTVDYVITLTNEQQEVVHLLLECYRQSDFNDLRLLKIFDLPIFTQKGYSRKTAIKPFGTKENYLKVVDELEKIMY